MTRNGPAQIVWDITYTCPLRCVHCYSESGRRPARQLDLDGMLRVADGLIELGPDSIALAGGEPLLVKGVFDVAERLARAGIEVILYTSGWSLQPWMTEPIARLFSRVSVSVDGGTPLTHDTIRGRAGSYDRALRALGLLHEEARQRRGTRQADLWLGIDYVVVRANYPQMDRLCTTVAERFPELGFVFFGAAVPAGLASRAGFQRHELVSDAQARELAEGELAARLQTLVPDTLAVRTTDNAFLWMYEVAIAEGGGFHALQVEPDGAVRAMPIYEGTVGSLLTDPPAELWRRAVARWSDPYVVETLAPVRTMAGWAEATRALDLRFAAPEDLARIERRPAYPAPRL
ncbi:radical SAM protein [Streptomyces palmae]|uniref:Radical SAM protein n=1 Tax=Streptomyces palmae TaxID=1701085 RepID=A0A4Z0GQ11_9ACTN|nr:radical SAM protein [Streptomyces palmae]TGA98077.1 radical SAM protein [Streptomyces palmae]